MTSPNYLTPLFDEIEQTLQSRLYLAALFMTLTVPDICSSLEVDNPDDNVGDRYRKWCRKNIDLSQFSLISIDDIYRMRCKALHNGQAQDLQKSSMRRKTLHNVKAQDRQKSSISQYVLVAPNNRITIKNCLVKLNNTEIYVYSVEDFCLEIIKSGRNWSEKNKADPVISEKMKKLLRYHTDGFSPVISGVPVIA